MAAETWYAVFDRATGDLHSIGTVLPEHTDDPDEQMSPDLDWVSLGDHEQQPRGVWNAATRKLDPLPPPEPDPDADAAATIANTAAMRTKLQNVAKGSAQFTVVERDRVLAFVALQLLQRRG